MLIMLIKLFFKSKQILLGRHLKNKSSKPEKHLVKYTDHVVEVHSKFCETGKVLKPSWREFEAFFETGVRAALNIKWEVQVRKNNSYFRLSHGAKLSLIMKYSEQIQ